MPSEHHPVLERALEFADQATDEQGFEAIKRSFLCTAPADRLQVLDRMRSAVGEPGMGLRKEAQLMSRYRELRHYHETLRRAGR
jgi:hypothetical protein